MKSVPFRSRVGADGLLKLEVPLDIRDADVEVVVVVNPASGTGLPPNDKGWAPGFFERTAGAWAGEALVREQPGDYDALEPLE